MLENGARTRHYEIGTFHCFAQDSSEPELSSKMEKIRNDAATVDGKILEHPEFSTDEEKKENKTIRRKITVA